LFLHFWRRRWLLAGCALAGGLIGYGASLFVRPAYDATVRLMPPDRKETSLISLSSRNDGDLYLGLVNSRTVADDVIEKQHLADYFHTTKPSTLRAALAGMAKISVDKDQFVTIVVRAHEPETAVRIANEYPEALSRLNRTLAQSQAEHREDFFQAPLEDEKNKLAAAEEDLKRAQQKTGLVAPESQVQLGLTAISNLSQQITARQAELAALESSSTDQNAQVIRLKSEIASLEAQLAHLKAQNGGGAGSSAAKTPELTLEVERLTREVKYHEALFQILSRQYENARVEDTYSPPVELVDKAVLPDVKAWPPRRLFGMVGFIIGSILGLAFVYLNTRQTLRKLRMFLRDDASARADVSHV
jgi:tyrosine-protein kinase Etk/Wzc